MAREFSRDLSFTPRVNNPIEFMCDNTTTIQFAKDLKLHKTNCIKRH